MRAAVRRWLPGAEIARRYQRRWLRDDVVAGVVLSMLLVPAGIGYAQAAGLPAETGIYATVVPLLVYAVLGPSRILVLGPDSSLAPIIAAAVLPLAGGDASRAVALAGLLAIMMGALLVIGGVLRLGFVTDLLSKPIRVGYLNGIAVIVIVGQLPKLLGFSTDAESLAGELGDLITGMRDGAADGHAAVLGVGALLVIIGPRLARSRLPGSLLAVVGTAVAAVALGWDDELPVVGRLPRGLPAPALGGLEWRDVVDLASPAFGIALITFADTSVLSRTFAARHGDEVDGSDEMRAVGAANVAGGLLGGFPVSASSSRTPVVERAGAHTQLAAVVGALLIVGFVLVAPSATRFVPSAALAAVVIVAASGLLDVRGAFWLWRANRGDALLSLAAFLGVALVGVIEGIAIAIGLSLIAFVRRAWQPYRAELGRIPGVRGYHDLRRHPEATRLPGIVIVRFDAPLFFANGGLFDDFVRSVIARSDGVRTVILAAEPITDVDTTAVDELVELDDYLRSRGITLLIAEMKGPVKDTLARYGLASRFDSTRFYPTVGAAVDAMTGELRGDIGPA